jgi:YHS domain-containing protein/cytochrome b561
MKKTGKKLGLFLLLLTIPLSGIADAGHAEKIKQTTCPVMLGNPIDPALYVDYKGERIYFCCKTCVKLFSENPEEYLKNIPQTTDGSSASTFSIFTLTVPLGIATFVLLLLTTTSGLLRRKLKKRFLVVHKTLVTLTISIATFHALIAWFAH